MSELRAAIVGDTATGDCAQNTNPELGGTELVQ
jgi:hypothetical protein